MLEHLLGMDVASVIVFARFHLDLIASNVPIMNCRPSGLQAVIEVSGVAFCGRTGSCAGDLGVIPGERFKRSKEETKQITQNLEQTSSMPYGIVIASSR